MAAAHLSPSLRPHLLANRWLYPRISYQSPRIFNSSLAYQQHADHAEAAIPHRGKGLESDILTDRHESQLLSLVCMIWLTSNVALSIPSPTQQYRKLVANKTLRGDDHQTRIVQKLQELHEILKTYHPPIIPDPSLQSSIVRPISIFPFLSITPPKDDPSILPRNPSPLLIKFHPHP